MQSAMAVPVRFLSVLDFDCDSLTACLERAARFKSARAARLPHERPLEGLHVALLFEKPSQDSVDVSDCRARARRRRHRAAD
jgi:ornithine carbamoyltransferase